MKIKRLLTLFVTEVICFSCTDLAIGDTFGSGANTFDIEFVTIGNPGNLADTEVMACCNSAVGTSDYGSVTHFFRMGKFEISEQMIDKANAEGELGITQNLVGPNKPATLVNWNEAARFVNWLNTSTGSAPAYKFALQPGEIGYNANEEIELWTTSDAGFNPNNHYRNSRARYFLPSVDEWYKAAYHDPVTGVYYDFPTGSDSVPDGIDFAGDTTFDAVYLEGGFNSEPNDITDVGVLSPYGTASQGGNVWEWVETDLDLLNDSVPFGGVRGVRGGSWVNDFSTGLRANYSNLGNPPFDSSNFGFRVANVPEPSSILLLGLALTQGLPQRRRSVR